MIYLDDSGFPVEQTGDGGDSAVRAGIISLCRPKSKISLWSYESNQGLIRYPTQGLTPWMNPKNYTRDQAICFLAGCWAKGEYDIVKRFFWARAKHLFFGQNTERDKEGSTKYPYPHSFYKDSNPNTDTKTPFNKVELNHSYEIESKRFDGPDPMHMSIWFMIKAAKIKWLYPYAIIGYPLHIISLMLRSKANHYEENQALCESAVLGTINIYEMFNPQWKDVSKKYWTDRDEIEYHNMLVDYVNSHRNENNKFKSFILNILKKFSP